MKPDNSSPQEEPAPETEPTLSHAESTEVMEHVTSLAAGGVPLVAGLRAAAAEASGRRATRTLLQIADDVERGIPLAESAASSVYGLPRFFRGLVTAAARSGRLGPVLTDLIDFNKEIRHVWVELVGALIYPLTLLAVSFAALLMHFTFIVPTFAKMYEEFALELPVMTQAGFNLSEVCVDLISGQRPWFALGMLATFLAAGLALRTFLKPGWWHVLITTAPIVGHIWNWSSAAGFSRLLAVTIESGLPMDKALQLAGDGLANRSLSGACRQFANDVRDGRSLADVLESSGRVPSSLVPFVEYGERQGDLAGALREASDLFLGRLRRRATLLRLVSPNLVIVFVLLVLLISIVAVFVPILSLIQGLT